MKKYDVVIIGSGVGGTTAAYALKKANKSVALIENDLWGGTCPNRGCDPKKVLISAVEAMDFNKQLIGKGFHSISPIDWSELMAFKHSFTDPFPDAYKKGLKGAGIDAINGTAKFINNNQVQVKDDIFEASNFIISTGQQPNVLDIEGKEYLKTSSDFLDLNKLPKKITFIGAGYIAFELATIANAAGSEVSIIHRNDHPLGGFDKDFVKEMVHALEAKGIKFIFNVDIQKVIKDKNHFIISGDNYEDVSDYVICSAGRIPNAESLDLSKAGIKYDKQGISVDTQLKTSNPLVYACGDVIIKKVPKLTPVAEFEGNYIAEKILKDTTKAIVYPPIASIVYGSPKLASVGLSISEAKEQPDKYSIEETDMHSWFNYRRLNEPIVKAKLIFANQQLVGATILGNEADNLINYLAIIISKKITHEELKNMILGSPTLASDLAYLI